MYQTETLMANLSPCDTNRYHTKKAYKGHLLRFGLEGADITVIAARYNPRKDAYVPLTVGSTI